MKAPKSLFDRPGRATAVVGTLVAVSATAAVALVSGTATATPSAAEPGRCTKNVNVRAEPDVASRIVALCEEGTPVQVGEAQGGFLRLNNLGGWAAQEYISVNGRAPAPAQRAESENDAEDDRGADGVADDSDRRGGDATAGSDGGEESGENAGENGENGEENGGDERRAPRPSGGGIGGLLG